MGFVSAMCPRQTKKMRERPTDYAERLIVRVSPDLNARVHECARRHDMTMSELARMASRNVIRLDSPDRERAEA
jgi:hypothetical protein